MRLQTCLVLVWLTGVAIAQDGLVLHYDFQEGAGQTLSDRSGLGNDGRIVGNPQWVEQDGRKALRFTDTGAYIEVPFADSLAPKRSLVIEVWLRPETLVGRQAILGRYEQKTDRRAFRLSLLDGQVVFEYSGSGNFDYLGVGGGLRSDQRLVAGQWNQVVLTYDGRFFGYVINGRVDTAFVGTPNPSHPSVPHIYPAEAPLQIGRHFDGEQGSEHFRGDIASVKISMPRLPAISTVTPAELAPPPEDALNNFVRRVLEVDSPRGAAYEFALAEEGWVFLALTGMTGGQQACLRFRGAPGDIVLRADNRWEAMRRLPAGRHPFQLLLSGQPAPQRLIVRRIPELIYTKYVGNPDWQWLKRHVLHSVNICVSRAEILSRIARLNDPLPIVPRPPTGHTPIPEVREWVKTGREWIVQRTSLRSPWLGLTYLDAYRKWRPSYLDPYAGIIVDEIASNVDHAQLLHYTSVINQLHREFPDKRSYIWAAGFEQCQSNNVFFRELFAGGGRVVYERYLTCGPTEDGARKQIEDMFTEPMRQVAYTFPGVQEQVIWSPSTWSGPHVTEDVWADVDYKVFLDMQFHTLATHPVFRDLCGIAPWSADLADREVIRWLGALYRHYGIEGSRERLSEKYGYTYKLDHLDNPAFEKGTEGLDITAAAPDSVGVSDVTDEMRPAPYYVGPRGSKYLWMQRSANAPNRVRQQIRNLRRGKAYLVKFYALDLGDLTAELKAPLTLSVGIKNGSVIAEESERGVGTAYPSRGDKPLRFSYYLVAFRAESETGELELSDWATGTDPGGPADQRLMIHTLQLKPLFMGADE